MAKILIADDEEPIRSLVKRLLSIHGHKVDGAADGAEAIEMLQKGSYDLVILDRQMPKLSGIEVLAIVRTNPKFQSLKILMFTQASTTKDVDEAFESGVDGYIVKPFRGQQFFDKVQALLAKTDPK
ncbi:MAG: response regulator [Elusimicrobiota bacterium]|jgi:two-component system chemotaxis response regulator CheY